MHPIAPKENTTRIVVVGDSNVDESRGKVRGSSPDKIPRYARGALLRSVHSNYLVSSQPELYYNSKSHLQINKQLFVLALTTSLHFLFRRFNTTFARLQCRHDLDNEATEVLSHLESLESNRSEFLCRAPDEEADSDLSSP